MGPPHSPLRIDRQAEHRCVIQKYPDMLDSSDAEVSLRRSNRRFRAAEMLELLGPFATLPYASIYA